VKLFKEITVHNWFAVGFFPAFTFPAGKPLRQCIDHILRIALDEERLVCGSGLLEKRKDSHEFCLIIGGMIPAPSSPPRIVDIPSPACSSRVSECRSICGSNERHIPSIM